MHPVSVRYAWMTMIGLSVIVPAALIWDAIHHNAHSSSSVAPVGIVLAIILAVSFDLLIWLAFGLFLVGRSARHAAHELRSDQRGV